MLSAERMATPAAARPTAFTDERTNATVWWAVAGAFFVAVQLYVYVAWLTSDHYAATPMGDDPVPTHAKIAIWVMQVLGPVGLVAMAIYAVISSRRLGRISFDALLIIGWFTMVWQDPGVNFFRTQFFYNSYWIDRGSWSPNIPGWLSPNANRLPEPLVGNMLLYAATGLVFAMLVCAFMRFVKRHRPQTGKAGLVLSAIFAAAIIDVLLELVFLRTEMYSFAGAVPWLSIPSGSRFQFPIYEALFWAPVWGTTGALRYFQDDRGRSAVDRGAEQLRVGDKARTGVRILAFAGLLNVMLMAYNFAFSAMSFYGGPTPDLPSYLRNDMCGEGTPYPCPAPGDPIPVQP